MNERYRNGTPKIQGNCSRFWWILRIACRRWSRYFRGIHGVLARLITIVLWPFLITRLITLREGNFYNLEIEKV